MFLLNVIPNTVPVCNQGTCHGARAITLSLSDWILKECPLESNISVFELDVPETKNTNRFFPGRMLPWVLREGDK